jgi:hypothetical protein
MGTQSVDYSVEKTVIPRVVNWERKKDVQLVD